MILQDPVPITDANREAWLEARYWTVGASESASVLGVGWDLPIDVWQRKLKLAPPVVENDAMRMGRLMEPVLAQAYQEEFGVTFVGTQLFYVNPERPCMTATLDALREDGRVVEFKTASAWAQEWGDEGTDEVPMPYLVQVQHQMAVTGATEADLYVSIGGRWPRRFFVPRDEALIATITETTARFIGLVVVRTPPDWGRLDARGLALLNPECQGEVALDDRTAGLVGLYEELGRQLRQSEAQREAWKLEVLRALGAHQFGRLPDGRRVKRFVQEVAERTQVVKAHTRHYFQVLKGES